MVQRSPEYQWITADGPAFGAPGLSPRWTSSEKDAVGTAYSASSRVWFTVSHGILNEIYYPTIDRPQVRDFGFLISDGETFFHEEKRDLSHTLEYLAPNALGVRIIGEDPKGRYTLTKEIITDPHQSAVLVHVRMDGDPAVLSRLTVYALLAPHLEVCGYDNSARILDVGGRRYLVAWRDITSLAMAADCGFSKASCGYVGASDGWTDLSQNFQMDWQFDQALHGNIALTGAIDVARYPEFTVAIGFGRGHHAALAAAAQTLGTDFARHRDRYIEQWHRARCTHRLSSSTDKGRLLSISHSVLLAHEDKTFQGAFIASASIPWGQSKGDDDLGGYHLVWTRDMVKSAGGLLAAGHADTPLRAMIYLATSQRQNGSFYQNFWVDGRPYWTGQQLDETAFPILLAWRLHQVQALREFDPYEMVMKAAGFLIGFGPVTPEERWEEASGYSPSTLAAIIAAVTCAAGFARERGDAATADFIQGYGDFLSAHLEEWTVTSPHADGAAVAPGIGPHYMRILPVPRGAVEPAGGKDRAVLTLANRPPGKRYSFPAAAIVDQGFLELVRYGIRRAQDPIILESVRAVDALLKVNTPYGPCWRRYNHDGYGQKDDGSAYTGWGRGRAWPLLTGERAHYELAAGRPVDALIQTMERLAHGVGMLPEQVWDFADLPQQFLQFGRPTGSAMPLMWAHSEYVKLLRSRQDGQVYDRLPQVAERYAAGKAPKDPPEFWTFNYPLAHMAAGRTLSIQAAAPFVLHWTADEWARSNDTPARATATGLYFVQLPTELGQRAPLRFTFYWPQGEKWEGKDYAVALV